jgi:hypothetical protein
MAKYEKSFTTVIHAPSYRHGVNCYLQVSFPWRPPLIIFSEMVDY